MFQFKCPHCGLRDANEFTYGGDATIAWPDLGASEQEWFDAVYQRENPRGPHREYWHHAGGCRQWVVVDRDTLTHEIHGCRAASETQK
ncbi:sarcosine oxidase subunit delta [Rhodospirillaceae bacterium KN72]|uniref:Sarcosine oxidase subunit delta n=1 Tax=Pacificispira spongiicola TaxID=2729598 RepID=A0A7Y0E175_9PROT|nr:sarcosine oxidase subunit delta [Pacificispira spongiicola]NMM45344.1 sarcosine oxidase subunit delta [Pacificispira spongiicola]